jgi:toxin ParE1/3/4
MPAALRTPQADADMLEIWLYIANDSIPAANRQLELFNEKFTLLGASPLIGTPCPEVTSGLRYFPVGSYVLYYRIEHDVRVVVRVLHGSRDLSSFVGE